MPTKPRTRRPDELTMLLVDSRLYLRWLAILHVAAEQPGQHHTDLRFSLAAVALDDHHALALIAGNQAVADELLNCGNVLR